MDTYLEQMKEIAAKIEKLEAKRAGCTDDAEKKVYQEMIDDANTEFVSLKGKVLAEKDKEEKAKFIQDIESKRNEVDAKSTKLADVPDSAHNRQNKDIEDTHTFTGYFTAKKVSEYLNGLAAKRGDVYVDSRMQDGAMLLPRWMAKSILPSFIGADFEAKLEAATMEGKDVLVREASGTNSGGGSLVPELFDANLFKIPQREDSIPDLCYVKRAVGKEMQFPRLTQATNPYGVAITWGNSGASAGEGTAISESNPVFTRVDCNLERIALLSQASLREVRVNQVGFEAELMWMFRGAYRRALSSAILEGVSGVTNAPSGINTNTAIAAGVNVVARQTAAQVSYTDLVSLQYAVNDGVLGTGTYVISGGSTGAMKYIASLDDSSGRPVFAPEDTWSNPAGRQIAGENFINTTSNTTALGGRGFGHMAPLAA